MNQLDNIPTSDLSRTLLHFVTNYNGTNMDDVCNSFEWKKKSLHFSLHEPQHSITVYKRIVPRHINGLDRKAFSLQFVDLLACAFFSLLFRVTPKTSVLFSRNGFP